MTVEYGTDKHLALIGAPQNLHMLAGKDRADMLAFGRDCMTAERERCAKWVRDNYQDHPTIDGLCAAMLSRIIPRL